MELCCRMCNPIACRGLAAQSRYITYPTLDAVAALKGCVQTGEEVGHGSTPVVPGTARLGCDYWAFRASDPARALAPRARPGRALPTPCSGTYEHARYGLKGRPRQRGPPPRERVRAHHGMPGRPLISFLKRAFGLRRCTWRGELSFASYVQASVLTANLLTLARHLLA